MKKMFLILSIFFLITGCSEEKTEQQENIITENAALYYYFDAGFGTSQCTFVIETESNKIYVPNATFDLSEFTSNDGSNTQNNLKITYRLTDDKIDRCYHKDGFMENPTDVIEIISLEEI
jgi:hypothetical protein